MDDDTEDGFGDLASGIEEDNFYAFLNISKDVRFFSLRCRWGGWS